MSVEEYFKERFKSKTNKKQWNNELMNNNRSISH